MEQEGLVSRVGTEKGKKKSTGGRPPVIYQLTPDPEKRFEVLQSVRAFYTATEERVSELPRPESKHYFIAKEVLEESMEKEAALAQSEKADRLDLIKKRLEYARMEEEIGEEGTQLIAASFDIVEAKAIDSLIGDWKTAVKLLDEARKVCQQLNADDLVTDVQSYVMETIVDRMTKELLQLIDSGRYGEVGQIVQNLRIIEYCFGDLPGVRRSIESADRIEAMAHREWINTQAEQKSQQQLHFLAAAVSQKQTVLIKQIMPGAVEEPCYIDEPSFELPSLPVWSWHAFSPTASPRSLRDPGERPSALEVSAWLTALALQLSESIQESES